MGVFRVVRSCGTPYCSSKKSSSSSLLFAILNPPAGRRLKKPGISATVARATLQIDVDGVSIFFAPSRFQNVSNAREMPGRESSQLRGVFRSAAMSD
jgi:hypothetical protein